MSPRRCALLGANNVSEVEQPYVTAANIVLARSFSSKSSRSSAHFAASFCRTARTMERTMGSFVNITSMIIFESLKETETASMITLNQSYGEEYDSILGTCIGLRPIQSQPFSKNILLTKFRARPCCVPCMDLYFCQKSVHFLKQYLFV